MTSMHGHGPFMVWHQKPTQRQLIGARIAMCIYVTLVMCTLPMGVAFMLSQLAGPIWHWIITVVVFAGCVWYIQDTARGGLEVHDYEQEPLATLRTLAEPKRAGP
ncbi:MAG: hypothetical protein NTY30_02495 [Candidatus Berkelbacteria bacterium]|nr:hypothetical protein [Candidatus Berkelbacteria bacterium]